MQRGKFIVLEGLDGAGTSTQANIIGPCLIQKGFSVVSTNEPWTSWYGQEIRRKLSGEISAEDYDKGRNILRLFIADSAIHNERLIKPALARGSIVISDRYRPSSFAYQGAQGISFEEILRRHEIEDLEIPNLTFYLDIDANIALKRGKGDEKFEKNSFLSRAAEKYKEGIDRKLKYFGEKVVIIDATKPVIEVSDEIKKHLENLLLKS